MDRQPVGPLEPENNDVRPPAEAIREFVTQSVSSDADSKLLETGLLVDGKKEGEWKVYFSDGPLWMEQWFSGGLLNGLTVMRDDDGSKCLERHYLDGVLHGEETGYNPDVSVAFVQNYVKGDLAGPWEKYYPSGLLRARGTHSRGRFSGYCEFFFEDGSVDFSRTGKYQMGKLVVD